MKKKKLVVLSGAGISAESGIATFRASDGLWENHRVEDVASPEGWSRNPQLVLDFYNQRRAQLHSVHPNKAHELIAALEETLEVVVVTQNVDDLHERAGSTKVIHLHGELNKVRSVANAQLITETNESIVLGDVASDGAQLRPHIVWFGEEVPLLETAAYEITNADYLLIIGTSMQVYPAAGLHQYAPSNCVISVINPEESYVASENKVLYIQEKATTGMQKFYEALLKK